MGALVEGPELAGGKEGRVQENEAKHEYKLIPSVPVGNMIDFNDAKCRAAHGDEGRTDGRT